MKGLDLSTVFRPWNSAFRVSRSAFAALLALGLAVSLAAADTPPACLPDSNGDGQPLFGWLRHAVIPPTFSINEFGAACAADLDGDGDLDLAAAARCHISFSGPGGVSILLNDGDGVMRPTAGIPGLGEPRDIVAADFDGDGDKDLAVADSEGSKVWVLLNNGNATFQAAVGYTVGVRARSIAAGDFDGDGDFDLITLNAIALQPTSANGTVSVLFNLGAGIFGNRTDWTLLSRVSETQDFQSQVSLPLGGKNIVIADFDEDGDLDFAAACYLGNQVAVRWNSGDGTFGAAGSLVRFNVGTGPSSIAALDVNSDGNLDLVTTNGGSNDLSVLVGTGTPAFGAEARIPLAGGPVGPLEPWSMCFADFDGNGTDDVVIGYAAGRYMSMLKGAGGSFDSEKAFWAPYGQHAVVAAHFNDDAKPDLAVFTHLDGVVEIHLNTGESGVLPIAMTTGTIGAEHEGQGGPNYVRADVFTVGDWDGDGDLDFAATDFDVCTVVMNEGGGTFAIAATYATGQPQAHPTTILNADLDHDDDLDLVVFNDGNLDGMGKSIGVLLNDGSGAFAPYVEYSLLSGIPPTGGYPWPRTMALGDLDGDGHVDVAATIGNAEPGNPGYIVVRKGVGDGTFGTNAFTATAGRPDRLTIGDFDGDGDRDIVATHRGLGAAQPGVTVLHNDGVGNLAVAQLIDHDFDFEHVRITHGDLNGDGRSELLVAQTPFSSNCGGQIPGCPNLRVLVNTGAGLFTAGQRFQLTVSHAAWGASSLSLADMNNDGFLDVVAYLGSKGEPVGVCMGNGDGTFDYTRAATYGHGDGGGSCAPPVDFDGDGDLDIIVANQGQYNFTILRNRVCVAPVCLADFNNSGSRTVQDLFDYLAAWFAQCDGSNPNSPCFSRDADINNSNTITVQDLFDFLAAWFAGCP